MNKINVGITYIVYNNNCLYLKILYLCVLNDASDRIDILKNLNKKITNHTYSLLLNQENERLTKKYLYRYKITVILKVITVS